MVRDDVMRRLASLALAAGLAAATPARAQTIPEGQSCGGLLCDLGVVGHKTEPVPVPAAPLPAPAAAPEPRTAVVREEAPAPMRRAPHPRKRIAKAPVVKPRAAARTAETGSPRTPVARTTPPAPVPPTPAPVPAPPAPQPSVAAARPPVYQRPLIFQSIDPMLQ